MMNVFTQRDRQWNYKKHEWVERRMVRDWVVNTFFVGVVIGVIVSMSVGLSALFHYSKRVDCGKFERSSGQETYYDYMGFWSSGSCYVELPDGTRIPRDSFYFEVSGGDR